MNFSAVVTWPWRRLRWLFRARPLRFTRFGSYYTFFSLAVGAAAINTGNNLLYLMLGLLLGFIVLSGFLSDSCLWGLGFDFHPVGDCYVDQPAQWILTVRKNWFPGIIVRLDATWDQQESHQLFYWIPRNGQESANFTCTPTRRGALQLKSVRASTCFPFGLFEKSHRYSQDQSWIVFPKVQLLPPHIMNAAGLAFSDQPIGRKGLGAVPFDLRTYQVGDSSKRIHWKSTAKCGELMVSEMEEESAAGQLLWVSRWPSDAEEERFISFVASLAFSLHHAGRPLGLQTPDALFDPDRSRAQLKKILSYLAVVKPSGDAVSPQIRKTRASQMIDVQKLWGMMGRLHV